MKAHDLRGGSPPEGKWGPERSPRAWPLRVPGGRYAGAIMVHQLGCVLGTSAAQRRAADGDHELARARRCLRLPYHAVALCASGVPQVVLSHAWEIYSWHGGAANTWTVGLGVEGLYPLRETGRHARHTAPPGSAAREALLEAAPAALRALVATLPLGQGPLCLVTHRQSSSQRGADPGELVLRALAGEARALGIEVEPDLVVGSGQPWPAAWRSAWA